MLLEVGAIEEIAIFQLFRASQLQNLKLYIYAKPVELKWLLVLRKETMREAITLSLL